MKKNNSIVVEGHTTIPYRTDANNGGDIQKDTITDKELLIKTVLPEPEIWQPSHPQYQDITIENNIPDSDDSLMEIKNLNYLEKNNNNTQNLHHGVDSIKTKETQTTDENPNLLFCKSLVGLMDELTPQQNMIARIKIQQILYEVKFNTPL